MPANLAEGAARTSYKEFMHFLSNAQGSASEVETELLISMRLGFLEEGDYVRLRSSIEDIGRMLTGLLRHLKRRCN